ncbi:MAG TPA: hypothetical protein PLJ60_10995, partial [Chryseolinea sp.]|nr:hypothetical protein [Chryseolinea sp.]
LIATFKLGIYWLISGLILHLICRGVWVGMVGLSYTFPNGINSEKLKFKERFKEKVERLPTFQRIIINLEKFCSSLFSISFMLFMSTIGAYFYLFVLLVVPFFILIFAFDFQNWSGNAGIFFGFYAMGIILIGLIGLLDFITLGYMKRFKWFAKIYWPFDYLISTLTFSRFYRPVYYAFVSNFNRWTIACLLILFIGVSFFAISSIANQGYDGDSFSRIEFWHSSSSNSAYSGYYDDQNDELFSVRAQIPSDVIETNVLRLFIPVNIKHEKEIREYVKYDSLRKLSPDQSIAEIDAQVTRKFYHIYLDGNLLGDLPWLFHYKMKTGQRGYLTYIDIKSLSEGMHHVEVDFPPDDRKTKWASIPFYRLRSDEPQQLLNETEGSTIDITPPSSK